MLRLIGAGLLAVGAMAVGQDRPVWHATVLAGESGTPLAEISLRYSDGALLARSDTDGMVTFVAPPGAQLSLSGVGRIAAPLTLRGSPRDLGILTLEQSVTLHGTLLDAEGHPAGGQELWLVSTYPESRYLDEPEWAGYLHQLRVITEADGAFRFEGFWVEDYGALLVGAGGQIIRRFEAIPRGPIDIGPVPLQPLVAAGGQVVGAEGEPLEGVRVALGPFTTGPRLHDDPQRILWNIAVTDARGMYTLELAPGVYRAVALGGKKDRQQGFEVRYGAELSVFPTIHLAAGQTIAGKVVDAGGNALSGAEVRVRHRPATFVAVLPPLNTTTTDAAGCWQLKSPPEANIQVVVSHGDRLIRVGHELLTESWSCADAPPSRIGRGATARVNAALQAECAPRRSCHIAWQSLDADSGISTWVAGNAAGSHSTRDLSPGAWVVRASAPGYADQEQVLEVAAGVEYELTFDLQRVANATDMQVRVLGPDGLPASLAEVWLTPDDRYNDVRLEPVATGADGIARFASVPPGRYDLSAGRFGSENGGHQTRLPADAPELVLEMTARRSRGGRISGRVLDPSGIPVGGAMVAATDASNGSMQATTLTPSDGSFELSVHLPGHRRAVEEYRLSAYTPQEGLGQVPEPIRLKDGASTEHAIVLGRGVDVDGAFAVTGQPGEHFDIRGPFEAPRIYVPVWLTPDGTYHVRGLPPGDWTFSAGSWTANNDVQFVVSVSDDLAVHAPIPAVEFAATYTVSGQVLLHGKPLVGVRVFGNPFSETSADETDATGHFALVAPAGTEELFVRLTAPFAHAIQPVESDQEIEIAVHGAAVGGRVLDKATGAPIRTAELFLRRAGFIGWTHSFRDFYGVDGNGKFDFGTLPAGHWTVQIDAHGYTRELVELDLLDAAENLNVELEPTTGLRVRATDPEGNPVDNVSFAILRPGENTRLYTNWNEAQKEVWWPDAPLGPGLLTVVSGYEDLYFRGEIDNTGAPLDITLRPAGRLDVYIPEDLRPDTSDTRYWPRNSWQAQLIDDGEVAVAARDYRQMTTRLELHRRAPNFAIRAVAPGEYRLRVTGPGGFEWATDVTIRAGESSRVEVPPQ